MGFLKSVLGYATAAWNIVAGVVTDPAQALLAVWHFIGSVQSLLSRLISIEVRDIAGALVWYASTVEQVILILLRAITRIRNWIWFNQVVPVRKNLQGQINALNKLLLHWVAKLVAMIAYYYYASLRYSYQLVATERVWRIAAVNAARAYSVQLVKAALATVQKQASDGYNSQTKQREDVIAKIAADLVARNPVIRSAVSDLVKLVIDAAEIDDPLLRIALSAALNKVISALGVDKVAGDLMATLISELTGSRSPSTLQGVTGDIAIRLGALEAQWASFMENGGPELEQAGNEWKSYASLAGEAALIGFFADAVANPAGWARDVNATAGAVVDDTFTAIADLIRKA